VSATLLLALALLAQPMTPGRPATAPAIEGVSVEQKLGAQVPLDLAFKDERGGEVQLRGYFGKRPIVLALVYYRCPMLCTLVLNGLVRAARAISLDAGTDYDVLVISIDPRETPDLAAKKKEAYLERYARAGAENGWHFLTGEEPAIRAVADSVGFHYALDRTSGEYGHPAGITVLTPDGRVSRHLDGIEYSAKDLRFGLIESSKNAIGTIVDRMLLLCFHYDPNRGRYGLVVMNALRLGGGITVLAIAGLVGVFLRRERRRTQRSA
jgi:protein SCO1